MLLLRLMPPDVVAGGERQPLGTADIECILVIDLLAPEWVLPDPSGRSTIRGVRSSPESSGEDESEHFKRS